MSYELHRPRSLDEALALLERHGDAHVMAGATALVLLMRQGLVRPERVVSLRDAGMSGITREADGALWIGATTTIREAETSEIVRAHCAALAEAFGRVATVRIRCQATVGGNLAHADPAQDPPPMLIALGAEVEIARAGGARRRVAVEDFAVDQFATVLEPGELLIGVRVPPLAPATRATYVKFLPKTEDDYATVSVAAAVRVQDGRIAEARVALGSVGATAVRARRTEKALRDAGLEGIADAAALVRDEIDPIDDLRGSAAYKREMARVWTERAVRSLAAQVRFEHTVRVAAPRERTWALFMDVPAVARCVPGAEQITAVGPDRYRGSVKVGIGPIRLRLEGEVTLTQKEEETGHATMRLDASDRAVGGSVRAELRIQLAETENGTEIRLVTEATLAGRIGDLGQPLIKRQADRIVSEFARCLERTLGAET